MAIIVLVGVLLVLGVTLGCITHCYMKEKTAARPGWSGAAADIVIQVVPTRPQPSEPVETVADPYDREVEGVARGGVEAGGGDGRRPPFGFDWKAPS